METVQGPRWQKNAVLHAPWGDRLVIRLGFSFIHLHESEHRPLTIWAQSQGWIQMCSGPVFPKQWVRSPSHSCTFWGTTQETQWKIGSFWLSFLPQNVFVKAAQVQAKPFGVKRFVHKNVNVEKPVFFKVLPACCIYPHVIYFFRRWVFCLLQNPAQEIKCLYLSFKSGATVWQ